MALQGRSRAELLDDLGHTDGLEVLDDHQVTNVAVMTAPGLCGACVFDEQGAGKTVSLIFAFDQLVQRNEVDSALIVAPKSMVAEWPNDFTRFCGDLYSVMVIGGTRKEKRKAIKSGADVLVTNFETVVSMEPDLAAVLRRRCPRSVLVVDESFYVKNIDAKRTRSLRRLREWCGRAYVLCGTPAPNAASDVVEQFNLVDFGATFSGVSIPDDRESALPVVRERLQECGVFIRHLKQDVLPDLPPKVIRPTVVRLQPQQRAAYEAALTSLYDDLKQTTDISFRKQISSFLARRSALLQLCSAPQAVLDDYRETPTKLLALEEILLEVVRRRNEKMVIWSFYTKSIESIMGLCEPYRPVRYDGTVSDTAVRRDLVSRFQEDDSTMVMVANPAAAGAGLTLHRARVSVCESMSNQAAHYLQSLDRIHRRGQTRDVEIIVLLCEETLEMDEYDRLQRKEAAGQNLMGDPCTSTVSRDQMLAEMIAGLKKVGRQP
ncbi:MAG: DEAD/DEAH box helicase [Planctomycetota bacterium]